MTILIFKLMDLRSWPILEFFDSKNNWWFVLNICFDKLLSDRKIDPIEKETKFYEVVEAGNNSTC